MNILFCFRPLKRRQDLDLFDEFFSEPGPRKQARMTKPAQSSQPQALKCTVPGCPAFIIQSVFKNASNYKKHM